VAREILTLKGESDGTSASGDFPLYSDLIYHDSAPYTPPTKGRDTLRVEGEDLG
jgi:hypothetical protein